MRSCKKSLWAAAFAAFLILVTSCTKVDDTVGDNLVVGGGANDLKIQIDTLGVLPEQVIKVYQTYTDSIGRKGGAIMRGSMNLNTGYFGSVVDSYFGKTVAASMMTASPIESSKPNFFKNMRKSIDSVKMIVNMKYIAGDHAVKQTFNIYRLKDSLAYGADTVYYHSVDYEKHIDKTQPLFSFEYSGQPKDVEEIKLKVLSQGSVFIDEYLAADTTLYYKDKRADFLKKFKGFVVAVAPSSPEAASIYVNYLPNTYINFYYQRDRDQWEIDEDAKNKDKNVTAFAQWYMSDRVSGINTSVASIKHDFTGTSFEGVRNGGMVEAPNAAYINGLGGVTATLEFGEGFFDAIEALKPSDEYSIFVNQARLFVWVKDHNVEAYDKSFQKLGSYKTYGKLDVIPDYYISDTENNSMVIPYDGALNRNPGKGYYEMDITSFMQHAILNKEKKDRKFTLAPTYTPYEPFANARTVLQTHGSNEPIRVRLTYTLIKNNR